MKAAQQPWILMAGGLLLAGSMAVAAPPTAIQFDGSLGPAQTLMPGASNTYTIPASLGRSVGSNLFESFSTFNLGAGDVAQFQAGAQTSTIIARVTGGAASSLDGTLSSPVSLFFINPAGVMFGAGAQMDVTGAFVVGTADYLKFNDGSFFYADTNHPIADQGLTTAPVSAFGFLRSAPQPVTFSGSQMITGVGGGLHVLGGNITLDNATLLAPGGQLTLFSAASAGEVPFQLAAPGACLANATNPAFGTITLRNGSLAAIDGSGGGAVRIRGGRIVADHSLITSFNSGAIVGGNISVIADQVSLTGGAAIATDAHPGATAAGGSIGITTTGDLQVSGAGANGIGSQISADTETATNTGGIDLHVGGTLQLQDSGSILANSDGGGQAGTVTVQARAANLGGTASISVGGGTNGSGGTIDVEVAGALNMSDHASITADSVGGASATGNITVRALQLNMTGTSQISASVYYGGQGANAGQVDVEAGTITIQGNGALVPTFLGLVGETGIVAETYDLADSGDGGVVTVKTGALVMNGGAAISASTFGSGNGGDVSVSCTTGQLGNQSEISSSSFAGNGGEVTVAATQSLKLGSNSLIDTSAAIDGGNIRVQVGQMLYLQDSQILAYAGVHYLYGPQVEYTGGNILIDPQFVILNNSVISANDLAPTGSDGNIQNDTAYFFTSASTLHATGTIDTTDPDLDLARDLVGLPADLVHAENRLREQCARSINHEFSSFVVVGRGGIELAPEELQPDFGL